MGQSAENASQENSNVTPLPEPEPPTIEGFLQEKEAWEKERLEITTALEKAVRENAVLSKEVSKLQMKAGQLDKLWDGALGGLVEASTQLQQLRQEREQGGG